MERDGWVVRQPDPADGRIKRVVATQKAVEVWGEVSKTGREVLERAYRGVHPAEIETVKRVLGRVRKTWARDFFITIVSILTAYRGGDSWKINHLRAAFREVFEIGLHGLRRAGQIGQIRQTAVLSATAG